MSVLYLVLWLWLAGEYLFGLHGDQLIFLFIAGLPASLLVELISSSTTSGFFQAVMLLVFGLAQYASIGWLVDSFRKRAQWVSSTNTKP